MALVLGIGIATVDTLFTVERFPAENDKVRANAVQTRRGGNATNTLVVLSQLGHRAAWGGVLADNATSTPIVEDLNSHRIDLRCCKRVPTGSAPVSFILQTRHAATRTIVHYRDLPEFTHEDFTRIDLAPFDWIHFEGRNCQDTRRMLLHANQTRTGKTRISLEVEQARKNIEDLFESCDVLMFSQRYAEQRGFDDPLAFLLSASATLPRHVLTCTWGANGAAATDPSTPPFRCPAFNPATVVDTVGAGDTFNAGIIDALLRGDPLPTALAAACRLAGEKCGRTGLRLG